MDASCSSCGKAVSGGDVLYTEDARVVCPTCFAKADVVATQQRASGGTGSLVAGAIAGVVPFMIHVTSSSVVTHNGEIVESSYRDWVAIGGGAIALVCGAIAVVAARAAGGGSRLALGALVVLLGAYQVVRGFGWIG